MTDKEKKLLKPIFWDTDIDKLDVMKYKRYTIERILQFGLAEHVRWMLKHFEKEDIKETVKKSKVIDKKTATYWSIHFDINKEDILCFSKQSARSNTMF